MEKPKINHAPKYVCPWCGRPSYIEPDEQPLPADYCGDDDHGQPDLEDSE